MDSKLFAACALDGSWSTPFAYTSVFYTDKVIFLVRDYDSTDIDVMDYSGKLLYNTRSLGCYKDIPEKSAYSFIDGYGEGLAAITLTSGKTAYIDILTGNVHYTDFEKGRAFHDGLSAVTQDGLVGYLDKSFSLVIPPQYTEAELFYDGKAIVKTGTNYAVIDKSGKVLLENPYLINRWDKYTYAVYDKNNDAQYLNSNLVKVTAGDNEISHISNGWFYYNTDTSTVIFNGSEKHTFESVVHPDLISSGFVRYHINSSDVRLEGLMTISGKEIVPLTKNSSISTVRSDRSGSFYITISCYGNAAADGNFKILNSDGKELFSGNGYLNYNPQFDLFEVTSELYFGYIDTNGNFTFRRSLLQYIPD